MKTTVTESMFVRGFDEIRPGQFSRAALLALFEYYDAMEQDTGEEIEFDPIAICCDWSEYDSPAQAAEEMSDWESDAEKDEDENNGDAMEHLRDRTTVLESEDSKVVVLSF